jgi:hypothetical protein
MPKAISLRCRALIRTPTLSRVRAMALDRVEDGLRNLRAAGVSEEDEGGLLIERGKQRPDVIGRKGDGSGCAQLLIDHLAHGDS